MQALTALPDLPTSPISTALPVLSALQWRYAVRRFSDERLPAKDIEALIEATRLSASAYGLQPYRLIQVDSRAVRERLLPHAMGQDKVLHCSHLLVLAAETAVGDHTVERYMSLMESTRPLSAEARSGMTRHMKSVIDGMTPVERAGWAREQVFLALGTLLAAAASMQIDSCPMTGFEAQGFDQVLGLSTQGLTATALCALGRRHPEDDHASLAKVRLPANDFAQVI
ncbi:nitroreductase family protein [Microbulbifer sp. CAU 1566]|uniref:nitroreductase family protein n=1 Tax=Microbulbifer sp. CAU 1566 TaxID=2933269 RepID=UPI002003B100|nr:nitroreductase family protein [Microbulbifer sp. CAU 1566]MCK7596525.1 nitroreductase family protein [Microbulbifer sp. CAU 1566]